jgi:hypothetical protein
VILGRLRGTNSVCLSLHQGLDFLEESRKIGTREPDVWCGKTVVLHVGWHMLVVGECDQDPEVPFHRLKSARVSSYAS